MSNKRKLRSKREQDRRQWKYTHCRKCRAELVPKYLDNDLRIVTCPSCGWIPVADRLKIAAAVTRAQDAMVGQEEA